MSRWCAVAVILPKRKKLDHTIPAWADVGALFFITLCCQPRGHNQLCREPAAGVLLDSARYRHEIGHWWLELLLLMPDHLHMLVAFPEDQDMARIVSLWKQYAARRTDVTWQRNFFDHRIRHHGSAEQKAEYIRMNPVRAGLVKKPEDWPYVISPVQVR